MQKTRQDKELLLELLNEKETRIRYNKLNTIFPDDGPYRRELYPKHIAFMEAGATFRERAFIAGNRTGKSLTVCTELTYHVTGRYPEWWKGKRFHKPITAWACGETTKTARDILQKELLGPRNDLGSGLIPKDCLKKEPLSKPGVPGGIEVVEVEYITGGTSYLFFKSYDAGMGAFMGTAIEFIALDEEPPMDIYVECLMRTATTKGCVVCSFTPLKSLSDVVLAFLPGGRLPDDVGLKYVTMVSWSEIPHLDEETKASLLESIPPYLRDARTKGIPQLGSGAIYPIADEDITVKPFDIPDHWPRVYGMDVGWNRTAVVWAAWDRDSDIIYLYSEHYRGQAEPSIHADAIKSRGEWILGAIDPASRGRSQVDGTQLLLLYMKLGLSLVTADNSRESGLYAVYQRLSSGRLKVFSTLQNWFDEKRVYRRDENGKVVKEHDHLMDATRYLIVSGLPLMRLQPNEEEDEQVTERTLGKSPVTGY